jgi:metal-responsive CopG/Arc/MetJ family transcriptional regulator
MHINISRSSAMRSTVTIEKMMLDELLTETHAKSKATAVRVAISDYLRRRRAEKIKSMKGKLEFDVTAEELRHYER